MDQPTKQLSSIQRIGPNHNIHQPYTTLNQPQVDPNFPEDLMF